MKFVLCIFALCMLGHGLLLGHEQDSRPRYVGFSVENIRAATSNVAPPLEVAKQCGSRNPEYKQDKDRLKLMHAIAMEDLATEEERQIVEKNPVYRRLREQGETAVLGVDLMEGLVGVELSHDPSIYWRAQNLEIPQFTTKSEAYRFIYEDFRGKVGGLRMAKLKRNGGALKPAVTAAVVAEARPELAAGRWVDGRGGLTPWAYLVISEGIIFLLFLWMLFLAVRALRVGRAARGYVLAVRVLCAMELCAFSKHFTDANVQLVLWLSVVLLLVFMRRLLCVLAGVDARAGSTYVLLPREFRSVKGEVKRRSLLPVWIKQMLWLSFVLFCVGPLCRTGRDYGEFYLFWLFLCCGALVYAGFKRVVPQWIGSISLLLVVAYNPFVRFDFLRVRLYSEDLVILGTCVLFIIALCVRGDKGGENK